MIEKLERIFELLPQVQDPMVQQFFDTDSEKLLDEKIEVLEALVRGKAPADISAYYSILELMPENQHWDIA